MLSEFASELEERTARSFGKRRARLHALARERVREREPGGVEELAREAQARGTP